MFVMGSYLEVLQTCVDYYLKKTQNYKKGEREVQS